MCLLVHQPSSTTFSDEFLADVYSGNRDGIGVMYSSGGQLVVVKALPASVDQFIAFYREHIEGRESVWHARMQTHGDIDLENCHPYGVTSRVALAHNGILSTGNAWDKSKSDTWHFIRNVIRPAVEADESIVLDPTWQSFIGSLIGSANKFGMMTASGSAVIINRAAGVEFRGAWL
jgi:predicted glutamine amidotransferase